jgi:DNA-directed RNA polymerase specialized sigma24 family protein
LVGANQLTLLSDLELLKALCSPQGDEKTYSEFVRRFLPDVKEECIRIGTRRKVDRHTSIQIAHDTFEKARKYKTFKEDEIKIPDSRKAVLVYLYRIATNQFNDYYNKEKKERGSVAHKTYFDDLIPVDGLETDPEKLLRIKEASLAILKKLNPKEKAVVLADLEYKKHHKYLYLPDVVNERLANELGVKKESLRKIRERAIAKLKKAFDEINQE